MSKLAALVARALVVTPIAVLIACGSLGPSTGEQCQKLVNTTNAGMKKVENTKEEDPEATAKALDGLIAEIDGVGVKDDGLKKLVEQFETTLKTAASTHRDMAAMKKSLDATSGPPADFDKRMDELEKKFDKFVKDQDAIVDKINEYCKDK
jgi:predicted ATP-grasp superfamily ATP-dependent carboligase